MKYVDGYPRRIRMDCWQPSELAIYNAMQEVEKPPADPRQTEAINLLSKAKELIADVIEEKVNTQ
jgi:hypothetical protein